MANKNPGQSHPSHRSLDLPSFEISVDEPLTSASRFQDHVTLSGDPWQLPMPTRVTDNTLSELGEKIFLDRYALKDVRKASLKLGDTVVVCIDLKTGQREIGTVQSIDSQSITAQLRSGETITRPIDQLDKPLELKIEQLMDRVAKGIAEVELPTQRATWEKRFRWLLDGFKFVPAGRILTAAGTDQQLTYYNCYVIPSPKDSRQGIMETLTQMTEVMSRGGGVGINLSSLRPRYAYVKGVNGRSSGAVSWGAVYSFVTGLIEQGGSRRGALMLILDCWHPDVLDFIVSKRAMGKITNANISIGLTDRFMQAVKQDEDWDLVFPDTTDPDYNQLWDGNLEAWQKQGKPVKLYKTVKAKAIWDSIIESAWASAEPGVFFSERYNKLSNSWYFAPIRCTNPCAEQGLPPWGVCNLGAINLAKFVSQGDDGRATVDWELLRTTIRFAVRFLDNVIDATPYFFEENKRQQKSERRVGLNTMGLAEMLIKLGNRYGSDQSVKFIDELYEFIAREAYTASSLIAEEKGSFPAFEPDQLFKSGYMKRMPEDIRQLVKEKGLRNVTLLTQAPNGTIGTMVGTATGIEPFYYWTYYRKSRLGIFEEKVKILKDWEAQHPDQPRPDYFITAMELEPEGHVKVMAAVQRWVDASISKTCNLPNHYTIDDTRKIYELMYESGVKAGAIYRDGSRDEQVLTTREEDAKKGLSQVSSAASAVELTQPTATQEVKQNQSSSATNLQPTASGQWPVASQPKIRPLPYRRHGITISKPTPSGTAHITMNNDEANQPFEVFIEIGKAGSDLKAMAEGLGRLISLILRLSSPLPPKERIQEVAKQLSGIGGSRSLGFGKNRVLSLPDAIAQVLEEVYEITDEEQTPDSHQLTLANRSPTSTKAAAQSGKTSAAADLCPTCGQISLVRMEACKTCSSCGYSECG